MSIFRNNKRHSGTHNRAKDIVYDNTNSGLKSSNINDAIDEIVEQTDNQNQNLGGFTPIIDDTGKITGYKTEVGADTVFPFSSDNGYTNEYHGIDGKAGLNYTTSNECIVTLVVSSAKKLNTSTWKYEYYYDVNPETKTPTLLTVTGGEVERLGYTEHTLAGCVRTEGDLEITMTNYVACVGQMIFRCTPSEDTMTLQVPRVIGEYGMGYFIEKVQA